MNACEKYRESLPLHLSLLVSGSHFPHAVHVAELGPLSTSPGEQLKVTVLPSTDKLSLYPMSLGTELLFTLINNSGCPQLTTLSLILAKNMPDIVNKHVASKLMQHVQSI